MSTYSRNDLLRSEVVKKKIRSRRSRAKGHSEEELLKRKLVGEIRTLTLRMRSVGKECSSIFTQSRAISAYILNDSRLADDK